MKKLLSIKKRLLLNRAGSDQKSYHLILDLKDTCFTYHVGDCIQVFPSNDPRFVDRLLNAAHLTGNEEIIKKDVRHTLNDFLLNSAQITASPSGFESMDYVDYFESSSFNFSAQQLADFLPPLLPRFYSIASSMNEVGEELHLLVKKVSYELGGKEKEGVCSTFLCERAPLHTSIIPVALFEKKDFRLTQESHNRPLIMVAAGCGMAPFLGFMQERMKLSKEANWLFFGERKSACDFYFEDFWRSHFSTGNLKLDLAFSRDQKEKIYVQDRMREKSHELFDWIKKGATLLVSGDASDMAKGVDLVLHEIAMKEGNMTKDEALLFIRGLRKEKRYLRDVY